jgi:thiol-disulfide isomerase/thioredoxin
MRLPILLMLILLGGCDRQSQPQPQPEAKPAASAGTPAKDGVDRSHAGEAMPIIVIEAPNGDKVTLGDFRGTPVLVNLWATWCGPCIAEMPALVRLAAREEGKLRVIPVSQDLKGNEAVDPWWNKQKFAMLEPYLDTKSDLSFAYGGDTLPTTILYDKDGKEVWRKVGPLDWDGPEAKALIAKAEGAGAAL